MAFVLPPIITIEEYSGDALVFLEAVYQVFHKDFVISKPTFAGKRLRLKSHPFIDGKEYTFYHLTHDGDIENERIPNLRRMERIPYPRPMIDNSNQPELKVWRKVKGRHERILIFHESENYLVVLEDRKEYILPWTAYLVDYPNQKRRLLKEYEQYKKTEAAQQR